MAGTQMLGVSDLLKLAAFVAIESFYVLLIAWNKDPETKQVHYHGTTIVFVAEMFKFMLMVWYVGKDNEDGASSWFSAVDWPRSWRYAVPGFLYFMNNNLFLLILRMVPASVFQLLCNLRTLYTGVLFYFLLNRQLSSRQWGALFMLASGAAVCQYSNMTDTTELKVETFGIVLCLIYGVISCAAGVYSELLLKKGNTSLALANSQMYLYGMIFNGIALVYKHVDDADEGPGVLAGWEHPTTWIICMNMALIGIIISAIMKYYDNVIKIFCVTTSNFVVYFFNLFVLEDQTLSMLYSLGFVIVAAAMIIYGTSSKPKAEPGRKPAAGSAEKVVNLVKGPTGSMGVVFSLNPAGEHIISVVREGSPNAGSVAVGDVIIKASGTDITTLDHEAFMGLMKSALASSDSVGIVVIPQPKLGA